MSESPSPTLADSIPTHTVFGAERKIEIPCSTFPDVVFPTAEEIKVMEDLMPGCEHGWFDSCYGDGCKLHYRKWVPTTTKTPKAVLVWMHGISDHSGIVFQSTSTGRVLGIGALTNELLKNEIALYAFDMYGHGYSEGTRATIPGTWENNKQDFINFCNQVVIAEIPDENVPLFVSGESYGGCLSVHVARHFQDHPSEPAAKRFDSMILIAPAIIGDLPPYPVVFVLRYLLAPVFPSWIPFFMPNPISPDRIWRDEEVLKYKDIKGRYMNMGIDLSGRPFRLGTGVNLLLALEAVRDKAIPGLKCPFLCQHGTSDHGVPIEGAQFLYDKCDTPEEDKVFHKIEGAYHALLEDQDTEKVVQNVVDYVHTRLEKRKEI